MTIAFAPNLELVELLPKAFYSPAEVAELASLSSSTILNYIHDGKLASVKLSEGPTGSLGRRSSVCLASRSLRRS